MLIQDKIENGYYIVKPRKKSKLTYMGSEFVAYIVDADTYPEYCVRICSDESCYSLNEIRIIKKINLKGKM